MLLEKFIQTDSDAILDQIKILLGADDKDFWLALESPIQESIMRGKEESRQSNTRDHALVMEEIKKKFLK